MDKELTQKYLLDFGLNQTEINLLTPEQGINYIKFHHVKKYGNSSILFVGFSDEENKSLSNIAKAAGLTVNSKISTNLSFICTSKSADIKRIQKAQENGAKQLTKADFEALFNSSDYKLNYCALIYDTSVPIEIRIAKPLSNFDKNIEVRSFSFDSNEKYSVNLYNMTCSCKDFEKKYRSQYVKGDLRRLCKHLIREYKTGFGLVGLSNFHKFIFENNQTLYKEFKNFTLDKVPSPVIVNFESKDEWWNIFIENEKGIYKSYGYSPLDGRFSYGEVPRGLTATLRIKLKELKNQLNGTSYSVNQPRQNANSRPKTITTNQKRSFDEYYSVPKNNQTSQQGTAGCFSIIILPLIYILYLIVS